MTVRFLGRLKTVSRGGCSRCGHRQVNSRQFQYVDRIIGMDGRFHQYIVGHEYEVSEREGNYLLGLTYLDGGVEKHCFEVA